jgi:hypothetical protein
MKEEKAMEHSVPPGLDPNVTRREIVIEADAETLEKLHKEGHAQAVTMSSLSTAMRGQTSAATIAPRPLWPTSAPRWPFDC